MEYINSIQGTVALYASSDDVIPKGGVVIKDVLDAVGNAYQFAVRPQLPPNAPPNAMMNFTFQSGVLVKDGARVPINQLSLFQIADMVTAGTTDQADQIADDFTAKMDADLKFRYSSTSIRRAYFSGIVVEFDAALEERNKTFAEVDRILNHAIKRPKSPFKLKRIGFGFGDAAVPVMTPEFVDNADFGMERRTGEPYEKNRYFVVAPMRTQELEVLMREIEETLLNL